MKEAHINTIPQAYMDIISSLIEKARDSLEVSAAVATTKVVNRSG